MSMNKELVRALERAKSLLILDHPFFGMFVAGVPHEFTDSVPTAATDGKKVYLNPDFMSGLSPSEQLFLIAHEGGHPMLEHIFRRGNRDPYLWNCAADYVLNYLLVKDGIGTMPEVGLYDEELYNQCGGLAENIYDELVKRQQEQQEQQEQQGQQGQPGQPGQPGPLDECRDASGTPAEVAVQEAEVRVRVAQAAQAAKMMGKLSANMSRLVTQILNPVVPWNDVMHRFMHRAKVDERNYARPNRRFVSQGIILPSSSGEACGEVVFGVDCSGSISDYELSQYAAEIRKVHEDLRPSTLHVVYFDSKVCHHDEFDRYDSDVVISPHGGGGTRFSPIFKYIAENGIGPIATVVLSDMYCSDFGETPEYPVLWVSTSDRKIEVPFGEVVYMNMKAR